MPDDVPAGTCRPARPPETAAPQSISSAPLPAQQHHGPALQDAPAAIVPPTLTPATTTRQNVALGALSTLWGGSTSTGTPSVALDAGHNATIPSIVAHAPSPDSDAQVAPLDLATSTGSIPSATTTLTNTLPPTQSAALRALNAPAFQTSAATRSRAAKSTSSNTSLSSQPVVVRTYSGSRHNSRLSSGANSPRLFPNMNGHTSQHASALSVGLAGHSERLPSVDDFSFSAILRAVDPEIRDAIDAIAEICARSRLSLADEYDAHLPPQGEITGTGPGWAVGMGAMVGRGRLARVGHQWGAADNPLTAVPEASSSSERLAGESRGSGKTKRSRSAYGSLKSVISGAGTPQEQATQATQWAVDTPSGSTHPAIKLVTTPQASNQISLDTSATIKEIPESPTSNSKTTESVLVATESKTQAKHGRNASTTSSMLPPTRTRSSTLSSITSWIPWHRPPDQGPDNEATKAEARLREMLTSSHNPPGKGKAPVGTV